MRAYMTKAFPLCYAGGRDKRWNGRKSFINNKKWRFSGVLGSPGGTQYPVCNLAQFCVFFRAPTRIFGHPLKIFVHTLGFQPEGNLRGNSTGKLMHSLSIPDAFPNGTTLYILYPDRPTFSIHLISDLSSKKWKKWKKITLSLTNSILGVYW